MSATSAQRANLVNSLRTMLAFMLMPLTLLAQSPLEKAVELTRRREYVLAQRVMAGVPEPSQPNQRVAFHRLKAAIASGLGHPAVAAQEMQSALTLAPNDAALLLATAVSEMQAGFSTRL